MFLPTLSNKFTPNSSSNRFIALLIAGPDTASSVAALFTLCSSAAIKLSKTKTLSDLENQGLIQSFEVTHELAWNVLKDYFAHQGNPNITGSRDATREAFNKGLLSSGDAWMEMIKSRNLTSHTYNKNVSSQIVSSITTIYFQAFLDFESKMKSLIK